MTRRPMSDRGSDRRRVPRGSAGLTVIELTVATAVMMVVLAPVLAFIVTAQRNQSALYNSTGAQADARLASDTIARNLRDAAYPAGTTYASTNSDMFSGVPTQDDIVFYSAVDAVQSGSNNGTIYQVEYKLVGNTLTQYLTPPSCSTTCTYPSSGTTSRVLLTDVLNDGAGTCSNPMSATSMFSYDQQNVQTGALDPIQTVTSSNESQINYVLISMITGPTSGSGTCTEIQTSVSLRNWRP